MATEALDIATILCALQPLQWQPMRPYHRLILELLSRYKDELSQIDGLEGKVSGSAEELNSFLGSGGFLQTVRPLAPKELGLVSRMHKLAKWPDNSGTLCQISACDGKEYSAFELNAPHAHIFDCPTGKLARLQTQSSSLLWLLLPYPRVIVGSLEMIELAETVMVGPQITQSYRGLNVPILEIEAKPNLSFLLGMQAPEGIITEAIQDYNMRTDEKGAELKVVTEIHVVAMGAVYQPPTYLIFDRPFYGWWSEKGGGLPIGTFYADYDSWSVK